MLGVVGRRARRLLGVPVGVGVCVLIVVGWGGRIVMGFTAVARELRVAARDVRVGDFVKVPGREVFVAVDFVVREGEVLTFRSLFDEAAVVQPHEEVLVRRFV